MCVCVSAFTAHSWPTAHSEALTALLLLLRDLPPSVPLLATLFALPQTFASFVSALMSYWAASQVRLFGPCVVCAVCMC